MKPKQLTKGSWSKSTQYFYSILNQAPCWCESILERDALLRLEFDSRVARYKAQPLSIQYTNAMGRIARYTPDHLLQFKDDNSYAFREVKVASRVDEELLEKIWLINQEVKKTYGATLEIITDADIRQGYTVENLSRLYAYKRVAVSQAEVQALLHALDHRFSFLQLTEQARQMGARSVLPLALLAHGFLTFDITAPLTATTVVSKNA